jgi:membrane protein YdbS with pleckstrin-like domain
MTNIPDPQSPASNPTTTDAAADAPEAVAGAVTGAESAVGTTGTQVDPAAEGDRVLDEGTFARIREPRGQARLPLGDGTWHQLARAYVWVQLISSGIVLGIVLVVMLVLAFAFGQTWVWIPGGIFVAIMLWTIAITPRQARSYGYQLRRDDLVFRRGILWQRMVAVPYGRMQLVDITHGPLDRGFGIAQLKLVTAAAATGVTIPGLTQEAAERLRDTLIDVAESRRTGL